MIAQNIHNMWQQHYHRAVIGSLSVLQIAVNFTTTTLVLKQLGFSDQLDVYYIALAIYIFLMTAVGWNLMAVLTPLYIEQKDKILTGTMALNLSAIATGIALVVCLLMPMWVPWIYLNYTGALSLQTIMIIQALFMVGFWFELVSMAFLCQLQAYNRYMLLAITVTLGSVASFVFAWISLPLLGVYAAAGAQVMQKLMPFMIFIIVLRRQILSSLFFSGSYIKELWVRCKYLIAGNLYCRTDDLLERFLLSFMPSGTLGLVAFVQRIYGAITTALNAAITIPAVTGFAEQWREGVVPRKIYKTTKRYFITINVIGGTCVLMAALGGEILFRTFFNQQIPDYLPANLEHVIGILALFVLIRMNEQLCRSFFFAANKGNFIVKVDVIFFTLALPLKIFTLFQYGLSAFLWTIALVPMAALMCKYYKLRRILLNS